MPETESDSFSAFRSAMFEIGIADVVDTPSEVEVLIRRSYREFYDATARLSRKEDLYSERVGLLYQDINILLEMLSEERKRLMTMEDKDDPWLRTPLEQLRDLEAYSAIRRWKFHPTITWMYLTSDYWSKFYESMDQSTSSNAA